MIHATLHEVESIITVPTVQLKSHSIETLHLAQLLKDDKEQQGHFKLFKYACLHTQRCGKSDYERPQWPQWPRRGRRQ